MQPLILVSLYKLNCPPPKEQLELLKDASRRVTIAHGSLSVTSGKLVPVYTDLGMAGRLETFTHTVPVGTYLVIEIFFGPGLLDGRNRASIRAKEIATAIEAFKPHLILEKTLEEVANPPGGVIGMAEGPSKLTSIGSVRVEELADEIRETIKFVDSIVDSDIKSHYQLCSRWFWKGHETINQVDKFLSWYIALEIYPALGSADVPNSLRDYLHKNIFPNVEPNRVKERLQLGKMAGLRAEIAHRGLSILNESKISQPDALLDKLEAVLRVVLRQLAGREYDESLDKWVVDDA